MTSNPNIDLNYIALIASVIAVISVFLPWFGMFSFFDFNPLFSIEISGVNDIYINNGIAGLIIAIVGGIMAINNIKFASLSGIVNVICGLGYIFGLFGPLRRLSYGSFNFNPSSFLQPQYGLILFVIASLVFSISTFKNFNGEQE